MEKKQTHIHRKLHLPDNTITKTVGNRNICSEPVNVAYTTKRISRGNTVHCRTGQLRASKSEYMNTNAFTWPEHGFAKAGATTDHLTL